MFTGIPFEETTLPSRYVPHLYEDVKALLPPFEKGSDTPERCLPASRGHPHTKTVTEKYPNSNYKSSAIKIIQIPQNVKRLSQDKRISNTISSLFVHFQQSNCPIHCRFAQSHHKTDHSLLFCLNPVQPYDNKAVPGIMRELQVLRSLRQCQSCPLPELLFRQKVLNIFSPDMFRQNTKTSMILRG